jgi:hypothetical protein
MLAEPTLPRLVIQDEAPLLSLLRTGQDMLWRNPSGARTLIQALVAEGRRFARTPEGSRLKTTLASSELAGQGRMIWQAFGLDAFLGETPETTPSEWLESILEALQTADLESALSILMVEEAERG